MFASRSNRRPFVVRRTNSSVRLQRECRSFPALALISWKLGCGCHEFRQDHPSCDAAPQPELQIPLDVPSLGSLRRIERSQPPGMAICAARSRFFGYQGSPASPKGRTLVYTGRTNRSPDGVRERGCNGTGPAVGMRFFAERSAHALRSTGFGQQGSMPLIPIPASVGSSGIPLK